MGDEAAGKGRWLGNQHDVLKFFEESVENLIPGVSRRPPIFLALLYLMFKNPPGDSHDPRGGRLKRKCFRRVTCARQQIPERLGRQTALR
jgi:hypothetical protein